jgi:SAM-dependent methyltransferase
LGSTQGFNVISRNRMRALDLARDTRFLTALAHRAKRVPMTDRPSVHHAAAKGFAAAAEAYQRARPDYPPALAEWLRSELGLAPGRVAVDLGAGTGKFTPLLSATGARVIAVEPVEAMRAELVAAHPNVEALAGEAERLPLGDALVDAIVCAQSFHWFAKPAVLAEMRRALRPGGALALVWNVRDERIAWVMALTKILDRHQGDAPRHERGQWRALFPAPGSRRSANAASPMSMSGRRNASSSNGRCRSASSPRCQPTNRRVSLATYGR